MKWPPKTDGHVILSIVLLVHICSQLPWTGNTPPGLCLRDALHLGLIGISPPAGSPQGALLCCDGSRSALGLDASIIIPSAGRRRRWMCVPSSELGGQKVASAHVAAAPHGGRRKVKGALYMRLSKSSEGNKKAPHFPCRKVRGLITYKFQIFKSFFNFAKVRAFCLCIATWETPYISATFRSDSRWSKS